MAMAFMQVKKAWKHYSPLLHCKEFYPKLSNCHQLPQLTGISAISAVVTILIV